MRWHACEVEPASLGAQQDGALDLGAADADVVLDLADHDPLDRLRRGGRQAVTVTHIHQQVAVGKGGKAVVAGSIKKGAKARRKPMGRGLKK
jgi:hypothetical protein